MAETENAYREKNNRGGHDLTADGWDVMARLQKEFADLTAVVADKLRIHGRSSPEFQAVHQDWAAHQVGMLIFLQTGQLPN